MVDSSVSTSSSGWRNYCLGLFALLVLVVGSYWPSMRGDFLWDDDFYVTSNKALSRPDGIERIWAEVIHPERYVTDVLPQFYPMTITSFWVQTRGHDWQNPLPSWPFHLVNVLLHFGSAWMLWTILRRLKCPGAFVAAGIWALHPVQVESVAWITERKNVLSGFFLFASMIVYLRFGRLDGLGAREGEAPAEPGPDAPKQAEARQEPRPPVHSSPFSLPVERGKLYALALILFVCSILSKSVTGTMPAVILLLIWWKRGSVKWSDIWPLIPFAALAIVMGSVTSYFEKNVVGAQGPEWDSINLIQRFLIAGGAVWFYAFKLICPAKLAFIYPRWDLHSPLLAVALGGTVAFVGWLYVARERLGRGPLTVALLFIGTLFPALGFVNYLPMRYSFVADHFQYIPCAALIVGGVWALHRFFTTPARFTVASALILGAITAMTWSQNHIYVDSWALWSDTINKNPNAWMAENNLGVLLRDSGDLTNAEAHFKRALEIRPGLIEAIMNLGTIQQKRGDLDGAIEIFKQAAQEAEKDPIHAPAYAKLYYLIGEVYRQKGNNDAALTAYRIAVNMDHRYLDAINGVGLMLLQRGDLEHARLWFNDDLEIDPYFLPAHNQLAKLDLTEGDIAAATEEYGKVIARDRNNVVAINGMGAIIAHLGKFDAAIALFERALKIDPDFSDAQKNLVDTVRLKQQAATQPAATQAGTSKPAVNRMP